MNNCFYHPQKKAVAECANNCKKPLCRDCYNSFGGGLCYDCAGIAVAKQKRDLIKLLAVLLIGAVFGALLGVFLLNKVLNNFLLSVLVGIGFMPAFKLYHNFVAKKFAGTIGFIILLYVIGIVVSLFVAVIIIPVYILILIGNIHLYRRTKKIFDDACGDFLLTLDQSPKP